MDRETATPQVDEMPGPRAGERAEHHGSFAAPSTYVYESIRTLPSASVQNGPTAGSVTSQTNS